MNKKAFVFLIFIVLFCANIYAAQEGVDIANPEEAEKKVELEKTGFEEKYANASDFAYSGDKEKGKANVKAEKKSLKQPASAKTLEEAKGSSEKPLLSGQVQSLKKELDSAASNKEVSELYKTVLKYWEIVKDFVLNLPGIRQYRNSIYSGENYKKEMGKFKDEYKPHLQKDGQGVKMIKEGVKEF